MKRVLVTGASGGMGAATCTALAERGYFVYALDKSPCTARECVLPIEVDVSNEESVISAYRRVCEDGELYAIINLAGIYMLDSLVEIEAEAFRKIIDVNLTGAFLINKTFSPLLSEEGRILIITSELAPLDPLPFTGLYAVSKAALDKYAYSLRMELQLRGIGVSVLRCGAVSTDMLGVSTSALDRFVQKTELYSPNAKHFKRIVDSVEARSISPQRVAKKCIRIIEKKHPRFAYSINRNPLLLLLSALPKSLQLWIIKMILK